MAIAGNLPAAVAAPGPNQRDRPSAGLDPQAPSLGHHSLPSRRIENHGGLNLERHTTDVAGESGRLLSTSASRTVASPITFAPAHLEVEEHLQQHHDGVIQSSASAAVQHRRR